MIELRYDSRRPRAWMIRTAEALAVHDPELAVTWVDSTEPKPPGLESLFKVEQLVLRRGRPSGAEIIDVAHLNLPLSKNEAVDLVIDFTDRPRPASCRASVYLRPLYNGLMGENAALSACLAGDMPVIDIIDEVDGRLIDRGQPSSEGAAGLSGGLDTVMARMTTILLAALRSPSRPQTTLSASHARAALRSAPSVVLKGLARHALMQIYYLCCYAPHWHVGWRFTEGEGVWSTLDLSGVPWQRLSDPGSSFYADPFPITWNGRTFVFFEELDHRVGKGVISAVEFDERGPTGPVQRVLEEPWHLSYPFLMVDGGELWMVPESSLNNDVALYRCVEFPNRWERFATLLTGVELADATITHHHGLYYLFGVTRDGAGGYSDTLSIYFAETITGPWHPHEQNPIIVDRASARPAGAFFHRNGTLWRPIQDCSRGYGAALVLSEVQRLSPKEFKQVARRTIAPSRIWPGRKLHTLNRSGRLEVIDGSRIQPKLASIFAK